MYSQFEFLRSQLEEKDLLIRTIIIKDGETHMHGNPSPKYIPMEAKSFCSSSSDNLNSNDSSDDSVFECSNDNGNNEEVLNLLISTTSINESVPGDQMNEVVDFEDLYMQFMRDRRGTNKIWQFVATTVRKQRSKTLRILSLQEFC